ncbi:IPT/TIG domain-containing protein [Actinoplanes sp. NPDC020271]|uniref:IPT/TIG domain-containing protein n=1 Tax=Actinoplanes sp. NPDC020271 TaxID=3363896 RepID=UPI0037AB760E
MTKTSRARRATAFTAAVVAVAGTVTVAIAEPSAAYSASAMVRAAEVGPVVSSITPLMGVPAGGTPVTIWGSGFTADPDNPPRVYFGDQLSTDVRVVSDTKLVAVSPAFTSTGNSLVKVVTAAGTSKNTTSIFGYRLKLGAEFESLPAKATGGGEVIVTVTDGTVGATSSQFAALKITAKVGGIATTKVTWLDQNHVKVGLPAVTKAVPAKVQLVQEGFTGPESTSVVNYYPVISTVSPGSVAVAGGDTIKIMGTGFGGVDPTDTSAVTIGGFDAKYFQVVSAVQIDAVVPEGAAGNAAVKVTTPGGSSPEGPKVAYRSALVIDGGQYLRAGGGVHLLTVGGGTLGATAADFAAAAITVRMGKTKLTATYVDATHLKLTLPPLTTETADLVVWQDVVAGPAVTVPIAPVVTSLSTVTSTLTGGATVKVKVAGAGVATATNFMFGTNPAICPVSGTGSGLVFTCTVPAATEAGPAWVSFTAGTGTASKFTPAAAFSYTDLD